jgi:hypothetical protein
MSSEPVFGVRNQHVAGLVSINYETFLLDLAPVYVNLSSKPKSTCRSGPWTVPWDTRITANVITRNNHFTVSLINTLDDVQGGLWWSSTKK